ncbi:MAG: hypothetical protein HZB38_18425 [Planctomycetes bacterium]|nr:hypothetical protein [Planctomycetota bacterium]
MLRTIGFMYFAHPLALALAALCIWLVTEMVLGMYRPTTEYSTVREVLGFAAGLTALTLLTGLVLCYLSLVWIAGWRGRQS